MHIQVTLTVMLLNFHTSANSARSSLDDLEVLHGDAIVTFILHKGVRHSTDEAGAGCHRAELYCIVSSRGRFYSYLLAWQLTEVII